MGEIRHIHPGDIILLIFHSRDERVNNMEADVRY